MLRRRLVGRTDEARVAASAASAARDHESLAGVGEVHHTLARGFVIDGGADRHRDFKRLAVGASAVAAFAVPTSAGLVFGVVAELQQGVLLRGGHQYDVAAASAVA